MKILHLADLHIGKMLYGYSLIEDQKYLFDCIYQVVSKENIDVVVIAGDVYDRAVPSGEAVALLDDFLNHLIFDNKVKVLLISGNHDSAERLQFASSLLARQGLYIVAKVEAVMEPIVLNDEEGAVNFYLLPYFRKTDLKEVLGLEGYQWTLDELLEKYLANQKIDEEARNVLVTHTTCIGGGMNEDVGGVEWVSGASFASFDYVALGHLHGCHRVNGNQIYYAGSPLKLSVDEASQKKGLVIVNLQQKGFRQVEIIPFKPLRDVVVYQDEFANLLNYPKTDDYVFLNLLDHSPQLNAADRAKDVFSHLLGLTYPHLIQSNMSTGKKDLKEIQKMQPLDLFGAFYEEMTEKKMDDTTKALFKQYFKEGHEHEN